MHSSPSPGTFLLLLGWGRRTGGGPALGLGAGRRAGVLRAGAGLAALVAIAGRGGGRRAAASSAEQGTQPAAATPGVGRDGAQRPEALLDDRLLHDRPRVRRDPVDQQAGREL